MIAAFVPGLALDRCEHHPAQHRLLDETDGEAAQEPIENDLRDLAPVAVEASRPVQQPERRHDRHDGHHADHPEGERPRASPG